MVVKLKDLKMLPPNHKIFKVPFFTVSHNTSEQKPKNSNKVDFIRFPKHLSKQQRLENFWMSSNGAIMQLLFYYLQKM